MSWDEWASQQRFKIIIWVLAMVGILYAFYIMGQVTTDMYEIRNGKLPVMSGTLDEVRLEYTESGSWSRKWTEKLTVASIDGIEYEVSPLEDITGISAGEKVEFRVRDGMIVEIAENIPDGSDL